MISSEQGPSSLVGRIRALAEKREKEAARHNRLTAQNLLGAADGYRALADALERQPSLSWLLPDAAREPVRATPKPPVRPAPMRYYISSADVDAAMQDLTPRRPPQAVVPAVPANGAGQNDFPLDGSPREGASLNGAAAVTGAEADIVAVAAMEGAVMNGLAVTNVEVNGVIIDEALPPPPREPTSPESLAEAIMKLFERRNSGLG